MREKENAKKRKRKKKKRKKETREGREKLERTKRKKMVQMGTKRKVVDNSGVREVRCIRILEGRKKEGGVG